MITVLGMVLQMERRFIREHQCEGIKRTKLAATSTVSIGGDDREVTVSRLEIESGSDPIYLVLASYDVNVRLISGAVERVAQVVANPPPLMWSALWYGF